MGSSDFWGRVGTGSKIQHQGRNQRHKIRPIHFVRFSKPLARLKDKFWYFLSPYPNSGHWPRLRTQLLDCAAAHNLKAQKMNSQSWINYERRLHPPFPSSTPLPHLGRKRCNQNPSPPENTLHSRYFGRASVNWPSAYVLCTFCNAAPTSEVVYPPAMCAELKKSCVHLCFRVPWKRISHARM